ncbi:MAG: AlbA family DNA-binding domain-containing protein [Pseudomonadales bacterium]
MSGVFRCVYTKHNNEWSMLLGVLTLGDSVFDNNCQECWHKYPNYQFVCKPIQNETLTEVMQSLNNDGCFSISNMPKVGSKEDNLNWTESLIPSHASGGLFPVRRFSACICSNVHCHDSKLVAHNMPFHPSAFGYVREFLNLDRFHGSSDGRKGELCIDTPDQRGYIALSSEDVRYRSNSTDTISVVGSIDGEPVNLNSPQDACSFDPAKASDVELWLVTDSDEVVDYCSSSEWKYRYGAQTSSNDQKKLLQIIAAGESEHCEFKQYIDLVAKKNAKAWDLDKTVCALSNHHGGKLFIGVGDDTGILGINDGCQRDYECDPLESTKLYQKAVTKRLQESLNKNQCFNTYLIEHKELFILVVDVYKANGLNYLLSKNEVYIRRGASSAQMRPSEIQTFPAEQDVFGRELIVSESSVNRGFY